ncbi:MAG TPA: hypothetical protein VLT86_04055 [Vicinamibacterales bacterium]|nr:hypothetical protein [Vicinamibacterales bacterium]
MTERWSWLRPRLTRPRVAFAFAAAIAADLAQFLLGPLGWAFPDEAIDVVAMITTTLAVGFHPLLLPTFVIEFLPVADMLPTWTGCVAAVVALRRHELRSTPSGTTSSGLPDVDVRPTDVR